MHSFKNVPYFFARWTIDLPFNSFLHWGTKGAIGGTQRYGVDVILQMYINCLCNRLQWPMIVHVPNLKLDIILQMALECLFNL